MISSCKICMHADVTAIDDQLKKDVMLNELSSRYRLSLTSLWRHRIHMVLLPITVLTGSSPFIEELFEWQKGFIPCRRIMELAEGNDKLTNRNKQLILEIASVVNKHISAFDFDGPTDIENAMFVVRRALEERCLETKTGGKTLMYNQ